jgi:hypothetical protein
MGSDEDGESIRNLKKNRIIYGKDGPAERWFLLHLSVGCHIFFPFFLYAGFFTSLSILLIIIVKCLFILAAVFPAHISLAISRHEGVGRRRTSTEDFSVGIKTGFLHFCKAEKILRSARFDARNAAEKLLRSVGRGARRE